MLEKERLSPKNKTHTVTLTHKHKNNLFSVRDIIGRIAVSLQWEKIDEGS
jgi:hypothetical protein